MPRWILVLIMLAAAFQAAAQPSGQPIKRVYRADATPPETAFVRGFRGNGIRTSVLAHAVGGACRETNPILGSRWVSTTQYPQQAERMAEAQLRTMGNRPDASVWIYTIRPDSEYLSVEWLIRQAILDAELRPGRTYTPTNAQTLRNILARSTITTDGEVVSHGVQPANIVEATEFRLVGGTLGRGRSVSNVGFRDLDTAVNIGVHDITPYVPPYGISTALYDVDAASCSMSCDGASSSAPRSQAAAPSAGDGYCKAYRQMGITPVEQLLLLD